MILNKLILPLILSSTLSFAISAKEKKAIEIGNASSSLLKSTLKGKMKKVLKQKSDLKTIDFCANQAQKITKEVNNLLPQDIEVKRISFKNRNKDNKASEQDQKALISLKNSIQEGKKANKTYELVKTPTGYTVYNPIMIKKSCLTCHGEKTKMEKVVKNKIESLYPKDKAFGYKNNDFRGAVVTTINNSAL